MSLSTTTIIVLAANGLTAVVAAALLMLVLWQAPGRLMNQLFAITMLMMGAYSVANGFGRFIDRLQLNPDHTTYVAVSFYGVLVVCIFLFASEFAQQSTPITRAMRVIGMTMGVTHNLALWAGLLLVDIHPAGTHDGSYTGHWTTLGAIVVGTLVAYLAASAIVLYRMPDERGRSLWRAPVLVIAGAVYSTAIWPRVHIPLQALFFAASAVALGLPVLRYELFNPMAALHEELARKNSELRDASRSKSQFLANTSHELRTPLNSIIGYTSLVINGTYGALNDTQRDRLEKVIRNGQNLLGLINDVIDLNRIEAGQFTLEQQPLPTATLLDNVIETIQPLAAQKGLTLTRAYADAPPVLGDETRVRQIVTNILANAVKFTHQGGVTVRAAQVDSTVQIEIADTGIGIAPDKIDTVFAEFQQIDNSTTREYEGTGLGMAITKRLVEMHGGHIWLESTPGKGTTFFVTLPTPAPRTAPDLRPSIQDAPERELHD